MNTVARVYSIGKPLCVAGVPSNSNKKIIYKSLSRQHYYSPNTSQDEKFHHPFSQRTERKERPSISTGKAVKNP